MFLSVDLLKIIGIGDEIEDLLQHLYFLKYYFLTIEDWIRNLVEILLPMHVAITMHASANCMFNVKNLLFHIKSHLLIFVSASLVPEHPALGLRLDATPVQKPATPPHVKSIDRIELSPLHRATGERACRDEVITCLHPCSQP
jgi:hypothetical protein